MPSTTTSTARPPPEDEENTRESLIAACARRTELEVRAEAEKRSRKTGKRMKAESDEEDEEEKGTRRRVRGEGKQGKRRVANRDSEESEEGERDETGAVIGEAEESEESEEEEEKARPMKVANEPHLVTGCGTVKRIELWNFMCHQRFQMDFGDFINFVTGPNGSGKSAVVAALQVCLGLNAAESKRGKNLSDLIRSGTSEKCKIRVHLKNEGEGAYKPHEFGKTIIVERIIQPSGASSFALYAGNATGNDKALYVKKKDVDDLVEEFSLHVDNPCCVLDQDHAKAFLAGTKKSKYMFFLEATNLSTNLDEINKASEEHDKAKLEMERVGEKLENLKIKRKRAEEEYAALSDAKSWTEQIDFLDRSMMRLDFHEKHENVLAKIKRDIIKIEKTIADTQSGLEVLNAKKDENKLAQDGFHSKVAKLDSLKIEAKRAEQEALKAKAGLRKPIELEELNLNAFRDDRDSFVERLMENRKEEQQYMQKLAAASAKGNAGNAPQQLLVKLDAINARLGAYQDRSANTMSIAIENMTTATDDIGEELKTAEKQKESTLSSIGIKFERKKTAEREIEKIRKAMLSGGRSTFAQLAKFHPSVPAMLEAIEKNKSKFKHPPIYVGAHVQMKIQKWASPVEQVIGASLKTVLVDNMDDYAKLKLVTAGFPDVEEVLKTFTVRTFKARHNVASKLPVGEKFVTFLSALDISHDAVFNFLVDKNRIEGLVLVNTSDDLTALKILDGREVRMPHNVVAGYDLKGDSYTARIGKGVFETGNVGALKFLTQESTTELLERQLFDEKAKVLEIDKEIANLRREAQLHEHFIVEKTQMVSDLNKKMESFQSDDVRARQLNDEDKAEKERITTEMDKLTNNKDQKKLDHLRLQLKSDEAEIQQCEDKIIQSTDEIRRANLKLGPIDAQLASAKKDVKYIAAEGETLAQELEAFVSEYKPISEKLREAEQVLSAAKVTRGEFKSNLELAEKAAQAIRAKTESEYGVNFFTVVAVPEETMIKLTSRKKIVEGKIKAEAAEHKEDETVEIRLTRKAAELERASDNHDAVKRDSKVVKKRLKRLSKARRDRIRRFKSYRDHCENEIRTYFKQYLRQKSHDGDVVFDHAETTMDIVWYRRRDAGANGSTQLDDDENGVGATQSGTVDAKQLSGGERSLTTLALLLAIGKTVEAPFKVMDEFDVFMDAQARSVAISQLISDARASVNGYRKQCIFLTPLDVSRIPAADDTRCHKMSPPAQEYGGGLGAPKLHQAALDTLVNRVSR